MTKPFVMVSVPSSGRMPTAFVMRLVELLNSSPVDAAFQTVVSCNVPLNRNILVKNALGAGATHVLFVDEDVLVPSNAIERLLAHNFEQSIVGCTTRKRKPPYELQGRPLNRLATALGPLTPDEPEGGSVLLMDFIPCDLMLIPAVVLKEMQLRFAVRDEWFRFDGATETSRTEDTWFCQTARHCGFYTFLDWHLSLELGHLAEAPIWTNHDMNYRNVT